MLKLISQRFSRLKSSGQQITNQTEEEIQLSYLAKRVARRRWLMKRIVLVVPTLSKLLIVAGFVAALLLPTDLLSRSTYISENAIQPGHVNTYWSWAQVHDADRQADLVGEWRFLSSEQRADRIKEQFNLMGLRSQTQSYAFESRNTNRPSISNGTNVYALHHSPRTDGSETLVLMASWLTRRPGSDINGGDVNVRGVASVLALARYLMTFNLWSKDIIFLISDGFLDGTHAWLKAYHGVDQSNLKAQPLDLQSGPIWAALNIDYPFHSFSHIGIEYEGINGQLPNLDFINSVAHIARWTGTCPVTIHADPMEISYPSYLPTNEDFKKYYRAGRTIGQQMLRGISGKPSGPEGIFTTYRIDAIGIFAYPADGPHGFYTIGRVVESTFRSLNNLLERFHQSFFLYLMQSEERFLSVGMYLLVPLLIGAGLSLKGLGKWGDGIDAEKTLVNHHGSKKSCDQTIQPRWRGEEILWSFRIICITHIFGAVSFWGIVRSVEPMEAEKSWKLLGSVIMLFSLPALLLNFDPPTRLTGTVFEPIHLLLTGCLVSVVSVLNFPIGTALAGTITSFGTPFIAWYVSSQGVRWKEGIMFDDQVLESWILPFSYVVVAPLFVQALIVLLLKSRSERKIQN